MLRRRHKVANSEVLRAKGNAARARDAEVQARGVRPVAPHGEAAAPRRAALPARGAARQHAAREMPRTNAAAYSRSRGAARYARAAQAATGRGHETRTRSGARVGEIAVARRLPRPRTVLRVALVALVAVIVTGDAFFLSLTSKLNAGITDYLRSQLTAATPGQPFYMLLVGTDKSAERVEEADGGGSFRTDTIMLARVDGMAKKVTLVSIARDTRVDLGKNGKQKINAAYSIGGAPYLVQTVSELAGVPISHYAEVDFDSFSGIVDALGGIDVNVQIDLHDDLAGLDISAGEQTVDGATALALCRARHAYDSYGGGDFYRAANQRMVLGAILRKTLSSDPITFCRTASAMAGGVTTDLTGPELALLALQFRGFDMANDLYSGLIPTESKYISGGWYEIVRKDAWKTMMDRVDQGLPPYSDDSQDFTKGLAGS